MLFITYYPFLQYFWPTESFPGGSSIGDCHPPKCLTWQCPTACMQCVVSGLPHLQVVGHHCHACISPWHLELWVGLSTQSQQSSGKYAMLTTFFHAKGIFASRQLSMDCQSASSLSTTSYQYHKTVYM
jgi:hypothetical protein